MAISPSVLETVKACLRLHSLHRTHFRLIYLRYKFTLERFTQYVNSRIKSKDVRDHEKFDESGKSTSEFWSLGLNLHPYTDLHLLLIIR